MLSLVNYGSSEESDDEDNSNNVVSPTPPNIQSSSNIEPSQEDKKFDDEEWTVNSSVPKNNASNFNLEILSSNKIASIKDKSEDGPNLLSTLPPPVSDLRNIPWEQLSKLTYKSKAIRIMAPAIPEEVEEEKKEKKVPSKTGSGLLSLLPKPRNEFLATPRVLKPASTVKTSTVTSLKPTSVSAKRVPLVKKDDSDSDDGDENIDFFSLTSAPDVPDIGLLPPVDTIPIPMETEQISFNKSNPTNKEPTPVHYMDRASDVNKLDEHSASSSHNYLSFNQSSDELQLDDEALAALCGTRGKKRRGINDDDFKIIDINSSQLNPDAQDILSKNLTSDQPVRPKRNKNDGPTSQQKRKHQIIYLAHQAKEQELELQNTWSNNRMTKKQTQAKYGF